MLNDPAIAAAPSRHHLCKRFLVIDPWTVWREFGPADSARGTVAQCTPGGFAIFRHVK